MVNKNFDGILRFGVVVVRRKVDQLFLLTIIIAYLPSTYLDIIYIPALIFFLLLQKKRIRSKGVIIIFSFSFISVIGFLIVANFFEVNLLGYLLKYSTLAILFLPLFIKNSSTKIFSNRTIQFLTYFVLIESVIGIAQYTEAWFFRGFGTDSVEGTLSLAFGSAAGLTHQSFILTQIICVVILIYNYTRNIKLILPTIIVAGISILLASVVHMIFALVLAVVITLIVKFLQSNDGVTIKKFITSMSIVFLMTFSSYLLFSENLKLIFHYSDVVQEQADNFGKLNAISGGIEEFKTHPFLIFSGFGLGQYNSRASLLIAGELIKNQKVNNIISMKEFGSRSEFYDRNIKKWIDFQKSESYKWGSTGSPSSSLTALIFEVGLIGILMIVYLFNYYLRNIPGRHKEMILILILFLVFSSFQENYLELVTQFTPLFVIIGRLK